MKFPTSLTFFVALVLAVTVVSGQDAELPPAAQYDIQAMLEFVPIPPGEFLMGSPEGESGRSGSETLHTVRLTRPFYIGAREVTQYLWEQVMGYDPSYLTDCPLCPVENVTWYEAIEFCIRLSQALEMEPVYTIEGRSVTWNPSANGVRLPTEAEWEYVYRGGAAGPFPTGDCPDPGRNNFNGYLTYQGCPESMWRGQTIAVGSLEPGAWQVFDMGGNVAEWCWDRFEAFPGGTVRDPEGPATGELRVQRGGAFNAGTRHSRCAARLAVKPGVRASYRGFRLAMTPAAASGASE